MLLCVTRGSIPPGVQVESGNPLTDLQLPAGRSGGRVSSAARAGGGGGGGLAVATRLAQPVLSKNIVNARAIDLRSAVMMKILYRQYILVEPNAAAPEAERWSAC